MHSAQLALHEVLSVLRRRKKLLIIPIIVLMAVATIGAFLLPRKYESSTTILVQRDDILNPLVNYGLALTLASEDRLATFNEIIYSTRMIQALVDSLKLGTEVRTEADRQKLIGLIRRNIEVSRHGSESFSITYMDSDPVRAQRAATLLTTLFIKTKLEVENEQNARAVEFFERKLAEFREKYEVSKNVLVSQLRQRINELPVEDRLLYTRMENIETDINHVGAQIQMYERALTVVQRFPAALHEPNGKEQLFDLQRSELPFVNELRTAMTRYDEATSRYTVKHPDVVKLESQISELLRRMQNGLETEIGRQQLRRTELETRRDQIVSELQKSSVTQRVDQDKESDFTIYRQLYDEMKVKLEQARTTRDLTGQRATSFNILDPAIVPAEATKPNRMMIIFGGTALGAMLGICLILVMELLDTTVRSSKDIQFYEKPVIALIPEHVGTIES